MRKFFLKNFKKGIDKPDNICYTLIIKRKENKTMTRDEMFSKVIQRFGFENKNTILFAQHMETDSDADLKAIFQMIFED